MVETDDLKVVWIGAGNLATRLSLAMKGQGMNIVQLFSRTSESAQELSLRLDGVPYVTSVEEIRADADLYIFAVKDTVLPDLIRHVAPNDGLWVHTAGSIPMSVFEGRVPRFGVFYPMQTFSKEREVDFREIPFLIEAARKFLEPYVCDCRAVVAGAWVAVRSVVAVDPGDCGKGGTYVARCGADRSGGSFRPQCDVGAEFDAFRPFDT